MLIYRAWLYSKDEEQQEQEQERQEEEIETEEDGSAEEDENGDEAPVETDENVEDKASVPMLKSSGIFRNVDHNKKLYQVWYNSLNEVTSEMIHSINNDYDDPMKSEFSERWTGCNSREELDYMLKYGWPEGVKKAQELGGSMQTPRLKNIRRIKKKTDFGDHVDMQMIYSGQLDVAWQKSQREASPNQTGNAITLLVNIDENSGVCAEEMFWAGAVAIRLIDMLVTTGRNVRVLAYQKGARCYINGYGSEAIYVVKEYQESLDIGKLMVILGLAGFFRKYGFYSILSAPFKVASGLGRSNNYYIPQLLLDREPKANIIKVKKAYNKEEAEIFLNEFATNIEKNITTLTNENEVETY